MKIITFLESSNNKIHPVSLEALVAAQKLKNESGGTVHAIIFNNDLSESLSKYDLDSVVAINDNHLSKYNPLYYLETINQVFDNLDADICIFGHTYQTRDWVPRLSAKLNIPFISDCLEFNFSDKLSLMRPIFQAKLIQKLSLTSSKAIISFQAGSYSLDDMQQGNATVENINVDLSNVATTVTPGEKFQESAGGVDLTSADYIVSVGRGIGKEENIPLAQNLADKINAQIGSSRPVVDAGWLDHSRQIGSSGQTVSPKLYFAIGISGAIQHLVGMKGSKNIIAINKDSNAPIFEIADYAVIGDVLEILPKLTDNL